MLARLITAGRNALGVGGKTFASVPVALTRDHASLDVLFGSLMAVDDPDELLRSVGIQRHQLRRLLSDDAVYTAVESRREAVLSTPWRLEGGGARGRNHVEAELKPVIMDALRCAFDAVLLGYSVGEANYANRPGARVGVASVVQKPMEWFLPLPDGTWRYMHPTMPSPDHLPGVPLGGKFRAKFLLSVNGPTYTNPFGDALLSRAYWPWYLRSQGWQYWMRWLDRYGTPLLIGRSHDPQQIAQSLAGAMSGAAIGINRDDEVLPIQNTGGTGHFESFEQICTGRIDKLILGRNRTSEAGSSTGSRAAVDTEDDLRTARRNADIRLCAGSVQFLVDQLWRLNQFGGESPRFVMADDTGLEADRAGRDAVLSEKLGVEFSPAYIAEAYSLKPADFKIREKVEEVTPDDAAPIDPSADNDDPDAQAAKPAQFASAMPGFSPVQQGIEDALAGLPDMQPIDPELVRSAVFAASDADDLAVRLAALVDKADPRFGGALRDAMVAGRVLGYISAQEVKS